MKKFYFLFLSTLLLIVITACSQSAQDEEAKFEFDETDFTVSAWQLDNSHVNHVNGKLIVGETPVVGAVVQVSQKRTMETDENGEFQLMINKNELKTVPISVASVDEATLNGKAINDNIATSLLSLEDELVIHFPITIDKVIASEENVEVHARAELAKNQKYPAFGPEKYRVSGTIKDAQGQPLEGATINLRRDGVEGFSMSDPSDENGEYNLFYMPEDDENHYFYVHYKGIKYTLPARKVFLFPDDISVTIDVTLPAEGTIVVDEPPTLVTTTAPGALYKGTIIGVNVGENVDYTVTIPKEDGTFVLTLPKAEWEKSPTFFQTNFSQFLLEDIQVGDTISSDLLEKKNENEPNDILATEK